MLQAIDEEQLPRMLGNYELHEILATGGMAILYDAVVDSGPDAGQRLVIKRIHPALAADDQFRTMFADEARICSQLDHPRIVRVFELGQVGEELFIAMELVEGIDTLELLRASVQDGVELPPQIAVHILYEMLDALAYAHTATDEMGRPLEIVHRDISPGNILLSTQGEVKLADFGIARAQANDSRTMTGTLKGKYSYMSPEQVGGEQVDLRSDVFGCGIVLTELLIGRRLFIAAGDYEILLMVREVNLDRLNKYGGHIDPTLRGIIDRALKRHPEDRFQSATDFRSALGDWMHEKELRVSDEAFGALVRQVAAGEAPIPVLDDNPYHVGGPDTLHEIEIAFENAEAARAEYKARLESEPVNTREVTVPVEPVEPRRATSTDFTGGPTEVDGPMEYVEIETDHRQWESEPGPRLPTIPEEGFRFARGDSWDLKTVAPIRLLYEMASQGATGVLTAEVSTIKKRVYLTEGRPIEIETNVAGEALSELLVSHGLVDRGELAMAMAVLARFGNQLERALIELKLIEPRTLLGEIEERVRCSVAEICSWTKGDAEWAPDVTPPGPSKVAPLELLPILGAGSAMIDETFLDEWAKSLAEARVNSIPDPELDPTRFGLGAKLAQIRIMCGGGRTMDEMRTYCPSPEAWMDTLRVVYLLAQTGLIYFGMPV